MKMLIGYTAQNLDRRKLICDINHTGTIEEAKTVKKSFYVKENVKSKKENRVTLCTSDTVSLGKGTVLRVVY